MLAASTSVTTSLQSWRPGDFPVTVAAADLRAVELAVAPAGLAIGAHSSAPPPTPGVAWPLAGVAPGRALRPHVVAAAGCSTLGRAGVHMLNYLRDVAHGDAPPLVTVVLRPQQAAAASLADGVVLAPPAAALVDGDGGGGGGGDSKVLLLGTLGKRDGEGRRRSPRHAPVGVGGGSAGSWTQALFALRSDGTLERHRLSEAREAVAGAGGDCDDAHALRAWLEGRGGASGGDRSDTTVARPPPRWSLPLDALARVHLEGPARDNNSSSVSVSGADAPLVLTLTLTDGSQRRLLAGGAAAAWAWAGSLATAAGLNLTPAARARVLVEAAVTTPQPQRPGGAAAGVGSSKGAGASSSSACRAAVAAAADLGALCASLQDADVCSLVTRAMADEEAARVAEVEAMARSDAASDACEHAALVEWERRARADARVLDLDVLAELGAQRARHGGAGRYREAAVAAPAGGAAAAAAGDA